MKKHILNSMIYLFLLTSGAFAQEAENDFKKLVEAFEESITTRHFDAAQTHLASLLPLMKKDIKETKKLLVKAHKEKDEDSEQLYTESLAKKEELLESITALVNTSAAALRVKADDVLLAVKSFEGLK